MGWQDAPIVGEKPASSAERGMRQAVKLTPEEQSKSDAFERSPGNIKELQSEIARTNDPEKLALLLGAHDQLTRAPGASPRWASAPTVGGETGQSGGAETPDIPGTPRGYAGRVAAIPGSNPEWQAGETPQQNKVEPGILGKVRGAVEAGLNTAASIFGGGTGLAYGALEGVGNNLLGKKTDVEQNALARARQFTPELPKGLQTPTGQEYTENIGETLAAHGPSVVGIGPELGALGQAMKPAVRVAGDAARRAGTAAAESVVPSISPQRAANVKAGMEQGLTYAPHQLTDNKYVKMAGETAESVPGAGGDTHRAARQEQFNKALVKHVNPESEATRLNGDVLGEAMDRSGGKIGEITSKTDLPIEDVQKGFEEQRRALGRTSEDNQRVVGGYIDEFERLASENDGKIPGSAFKDLNSELGRDIRSNAGNPLGNKLSDLQDVVLDAFRDKLDESDRVAYDTSRTEYAKAKTILPLVAKSVEGDISPGALMNAVTATKAGKNAMGTGRGGSLGDLAKAGKYLVDQKSSGTAERGLVQQLILDPIKGFAKVATVYPAAAAYNAAGPALARAMVRKGLRKGEGSAPVETPSAPSTGTPPTEAPVAPAPTAPTDPRLAEVAKLRESAKSDAVKAALDAHEKIVQKAIKTEETAKKQAQDVRDLEAAAKATLDKDLRATLQAKADKLRAEKVPVGEVKELETVPTPKVTEPKSIPVGKVVEGQPEIPPAKAEKTPIPVGEATDIAPEVISPAAEMAWAKEHGLAGPEIGRAKNVAKALALDENAVTKAATQFERSPAAFDREINRILEQGSENATQGKQVTKGSESATPSGNSASSSTEPVGEQPRPNRAATPGTGSQGNLPAGQSTTRGIDKKGSEYSLSVKQETLGADKKTKSVLVEARDPKTGDRRGFVDFAIRDDGTLAAENVKVAPEFRKRGIAELMYKAARDAGHDIAPGRVQTDEGHAMVEAFRKKGIINKEAEGKRFRAGDLDLSPIEGETIPGEKASRPEPKGFEKGAKKKGS